MAAPKKNRPAPIRRNQDNSLLELTGELEGLSQPAPAAAEAPAAPEKPAPALTEGRTRQAPKPDTGQRPTAPPPAAKPAGGDPYKGGAKLDAYTTPQVVAAIKHLAASDDRSQGYIVRKYLDINGLLADAAAAGFDTGEG